MIRYTLLTLAVVFLSLYSFRDWYRSLCGLIVMMAFIERYDMPRQMFGITGLNAWNLLMAAIIIAWAISYRNEKLTWDAPKHINWLLVFYIAVISIGFARMLSNMAAVSEIYESTGRETPSTIAFFYDEYLNSIKYVLPGLLLFHGCNSKSRLTWGIAACLLTTLMLGLQIIKWMPLGDLADGSALSDRALRVLDRSIGYHRVDLAAIMASGSWAFFVARSVAENSAWRWALTGLGVLMILSLALTGGRTGYFTWIAIAVLLSALKWKRLLFIMPILIVLIVLVVPAARERMLLGIVPSKDFVSTEVQGLDINRITSDRVLIWPAVVRKITEAPLFGYGRKGFLISGASREVRDMHGARGSVGHPHNAYLELLVDNGIVGSIPILLFFFIVVRRSATLLRNDTPRESVVVGGISLAFVAGQLIASLGAQSFYPGAGVVVMWCTIGLMLRVSVNTDRLMTQRM